MRRLARRLEAAGGADKVAAYCKDVAAGSGPAQVIQRTRQEAGMVEPSDIHSPSEDQADVEKFAALADAPVTALGLSSSDADALEQALGVRSVRELADNKYVRRAQAIVHLANQKRSP